MEGQKIVKLDLPNVTLCAVDTANAELTIDAMEKCLTVANFGDCFIASNTHGIHNKNIREIHIDGFSSIRDYAQWVVKNLGSLTATRFNLLIQWDGFIVEPRAWTNDFMEYDYIGAPWPWHEDNMRVGNSGFCLRSKRLLDTICQFPLPQTGKFDDDVFICRTMRDDLESRYSIRFAPEKLAEKFSCERHEPSEPTFGFHGIFNMWRYLSDEDMIITCGRLADYLILKYEYAEVICRYYMLRKFKVLECFYRRLLSKIESEDVYGHFLKFWPSDQNFLTEMLKTCEKTVSL